MKRSKRFKQSLFDIRFNMWREVRKHAVRKVSAILVSTPVKSPDHVELEKMYLSQTSDEGAIFRQQILSTKHLERGEKDDFFHRNDDEYRRFDPT